MITISAILKRTAFRSAHVAPTDRIRDAVRVLAAAGTEAALVIDRAGQLLGVITAHDITGSLAANGAATLDMTAGQLMTRPVRNVTPRTPLSDAMRVMVAGKLRYVPVIDQDRLIGLIGLADIARAFVVEEDRALVA